MSSIIIYVRRKKRTDELPGSQDQDSVMKIGSSLKGQAPLSGLTFEEEKKHLPNVLGIDPQNQGWNKAVREYWANISKSVPNDEVGLKLEIGIGENKLPINIHDWIIWKYCLVYGRVANDISTVNNSPKIRFYLYSKDEEVNTKHLMLKVKKKAFNEMIKLLENESKIDMVLRLFGIDADKLSLKEKELAIDTYATDEQYVHKFVEITTDKSLEIKGFIEDCIFKQKLKRIPNTQTIMYEDSVVGNTMEEAVAYFNNQKNTAIYNQLRAGLEHMSNKGVDKTVASNDSETVTSENAENTEKKEEETTA